MGPDLLGLLTLGMYTDPMVVYREYIQNAADSISESGVQTGRVDIQIDPVAMRVTIRDNGPGLSQKQALEQLVSIADSRKQRGIDRGFRGVGRLCGLAFSESVSFLTRRCSEEPVFRVRWDGSRLRTMLSGQTTIEDAIRDSVSFDTITGGSSYPEHFLEVEIDHIARFAAGTLLNTQNVRRYVGEVCPVPFAPDFEFSSQIANFLDESKPLVLEVFLDDENIPVTRPHTSNLILSETSGDCLREIAQVTIPSLEGAEYAAIGWILHSSYLGTLPRSLGVRGLRARDGNIQVGDESLFEHLFTESRLNRWCVGEIHILDPRIVPTGHRNYFEPGPHTRNLENHLKAIIRTLERRCREASALRNTVRRFRRILDDVETMEMMVESGYLTKDATRNLIDKKLKEIETLRQGEKAKRNPERNIEQLDKAKCKLLEMKQARYRCTAIVGVKESEMTVYQSIFSKLVNVSASPKAAMDTIEGILAQSA